MSKALHCYVPCINTHSLVPACLGQGQAFWHKCCPLTTNTSSSDAEVHCTHERKAAYDPKYIIMMRRGGSGAVAVCFTSSQGIPAFPSLGPAALRSLHLPCELPEHPQVFSRHLPVSRGIPWYPAQASLFPSGDQMCRRWAVIRQCFLGSEPWIKVPQRYVVPRARRCHVLRSPDSLGTHSASSASPGAV